MTVKKQKEANRALELMTRYNMTPLQDKSKRGSVLTPEDVLDELTRWQEKGRGNWAVIQGCKERHAETGTFVHAVLQSLKLRPVTITVWERTEDAT